MASDTWTLSHQQATLFSASNWGEGWTSRDIDFVIAFQDSASDTELALALGRTLFAVQSIKNAIRHGRRTTVLRGRRAHAGSYRGWMEGDGDE